MAAEQAGLLRVNALHWDLGPGKAMAAAVNREIFDLATWLEVSLAPAD